MRLPIPINTNMSVLALLSSTPNPGAELRKLRKTIEENEFLKNQNLIKNVSPASTDSSLSSSASSNTSSNTSIMSVVDGTSDGEDEFEDLSEFMDPLKSSSGSFFVHKVDIGLTPPGQSRKYESLAALIKPCDSEFMPTFVTQRTELCINRRRQQVEVVEVTDLRNFYKLVWDFIMDEKKHILLARISREEITPWQFVKHYGKETHFDETLRQLTDWSLFERIFPEWPFPSCAEMGPELGGDRWYSIVSPTYGRGRIYPEITMKNLRL